MVFFLFAGGGVHQHSFRKWWAIKERLSYICVGWSILTHNVRLPDRRRTTYLLEVMNHGIQVLNTMNTIQGLHVINVHEKMHPLKWYI